jgi:hypothetical protein
MSAEERTRALEEISRRQAEAAAMYAATERRIAGTSVVWSTMIGVSQDRAKAARLRDAMRARNAAAMQRELVGVALPTGVVVREVGTEDGLRIMFEVEGLTHCLASRPLCGTQLSSIR